MATNDSLTSATMPAEREQINITSVVELPMSYGPGVLAVNYFITAVSALIILCEVTAIRILQKCSRIPRQCRYLSISFLLSDVVGAAFFFTHQLVIFAFGYYNDLTRNSRIVTVGIMSIISFASVAALSLERVISLKANIKYYQSLRVIHIHLVIAVIWLVHSCALICILVLSYYTHCKWDFTSCDLWKVSRAARFAMFSFMLFYDTVLVVSNTIIYRIAMRHKRQIHVLNVAALRSQVKSPDVISKTQYTTTSAILIVVTAYLILQAPMTVNVILTESSEDSRKQMIKRVYRALSYLFIQMNSFVNVSLYVWKFPECKMHFYRFIGKFFRIYEKRAEGLRYQVFNIVTSQEDIEMRNQ